MSLLKFRAKVKLESEEELEIQELDLGIIAKSKEWVWRLQGVPVEEIYKITAFSSSKSIVQMYDGEKILIAEAFESLYERWEKARIDMEMRSEYNQEGESFEDDEE